LDLKLVSEFPVVAETSDIVKIGIMIAIARPDFTIQVFSAVYASKHQAIMRGDWLPYSRFLDVMR